MQEPGELKQKKFLPKKFFPLKEKIPYIYPKSNFLKRKNQFSTNRKYFFILTRKTNFLKKETST